MAKLPILNSISGDSIFVSDFRRACTRFPLLYPHLFHLFPSAHPFAMYVYISCIRICVCARRSIYIYVTLSGYVAFIRVLQSPRLSDSSVVHLDNGLALLFANCFVSILPYTIGLCAIWKMLMLVS